MAWIDVRLREGKEEGLGDGFQGGEKEKRLGRLFIGKLGAAKCHGDDAQVHGYEGRCSETVHGAVSKGRLKGYICTQLSKNRFLFLTEIKC